MASDEGKHRSSLAMADFWIGFFEAADAHARTVQEWSAPLWDPRLLQKRWLQAWSRAMDGYLRSADFLDTMRSMSMGAPVQSTQKPVESINDIVEGDSLP
jgi:hypothetical protein